MRQQLAERIEQLIKDTPAWYTGTRAKVEARAALEQVQDLRRVLEVPLHRSQPTVQHDHERG